MSVPLTELSIRNFKSIKSMSKFPFNSGINVLIGANGAGKSNLISFFNLLSAMIKGELQQFSKTNGGPDSLFFNGEYGGKTTLEGELIFEPNGYGFSLTGGVGDSLSLAGETTMIKGRWEDQTSSGYEAKLASWTEKSVNPVCWHIHQAISSWRIYHFHYTSPVAPLRRPSSIHDCDIFYSDGSNLSSFLWGLQQDHPRAFQKIEAAVRQVLPSFATFDLSAIKDESQPDNRRVWLYWKQKGSEYRYKPWQFSDGTLRFIALATALLQPDPPATIIIDEPELGLHPESLAALAGIMHEAAFKSQLIITTQSPDLLNAMEPEDVITVNIRDGWSVFERLNRADLTEWLDNYTIGDLWWKNVIQAGPNYV